MQNNEKTTAKHHPERVAFNREDRLKSRQYAHSVVNKRKVRRFSEKC
jgi:hypothetical protein